MALFSRAKYDSNVVKCSAVSCSNKLENNSGVSFFKFPSDRARSVPARVSYLRKLVYGGWGLTKSRHHSLNVRTEGEHILHAVSVVHGINAVTE